MEEMGYKVLKMDKQNVINTIIMIFFLCIMLALIIQLLPLLEDVLENRHDESSVVNTVDALGWRGPPALIGLAALQVVFPLVPAAAIGVLTGLSYGVGWGLLIFLVGIAFGNLVVVFSMRRVEDLISRLIKHRVKHAAKHSGPLSKENLAKIKKPEIVAFFLFMIPFISGAGPYLFAETNVKLWKYIIAVVLGCIPTAIVYVFIGQHISQGSYTTAIIIGAIFVAAVVFILIFRKKIVGMIMDGAS